MTQCMSISRQWLHPLLHLPLPGRVNLNGCASEKHPFALVTRRAIDEAIRNAGRTDRRASFDLSI